MTMSGGAAEFHLFDPNRPALGAGAVRGERRSEGGAGVGEGARTRAAVAHALDELLELGAVRGAEAVDEVRVSRLRRGRGGLDGAVRAAGVDPDGDAVGGAEHFEAH